ncbi:MAG: Stf0 family sulfotransferase, partial [Rubrivivax sp.]|nr:Stf0 family sulfotransferase [Rubrivivax sp.]
MENDAGKPPPARRRPDAIDLIGPDYDQTSTQPAGRTLIICSAQRTGSYELCRYLFAAGIGVPHEYFNANYACRLGERWGLAKNPLEIPELAGYIAALRQRRGQNGVFATKLQWHQFEGSLRNRIGRDLFEGATLVHLFRSDAPAQYASFRSALESGTWDFSERATTVPLVRNRGDAAGFIGQALHELDVLMGQDAGFRRLFALTGVNPIFVTTAELFERPREVIGKIAAAMQLTENS